MRGFIKSHWIGWASGPQSRSSWTISRSTSTWQTRWACRACISNRPGRLSAKFVRCWLAHKLTADDTASTGGHAGRSSAIRVICDWCMATIGVIADTHVPQRLRRLPDGIPAAFRGVDLILHAGDLNSVRVVTELEEIAPVQAVAGNADLFRSGLPLTRVLEIEGRRIGLTHGHGGWARYLVGKARDVLGGRENYYLNIVWKSFGPGGA